MWAGCNLSHRKATAQNSGVLVYCTDTGNWAPNSAEIQILDDYKQKWGGVAPNWKCAGLFGHLAPSKQTVKKAGE